MGGSGWAESGAEEEADHGSRPIMTLKDEIGIRPC
jgi:hypothetical protein